MSLTLLCGCEISFTQEHSDTCKCGDEHCHTGYWSMETPCREHSGL